MRALFTLCVWRFIYEANLLYAGDWSFASWCTTLSSMHTACVKICVTILRAGWCQTSSIRVKPMFRPIARPSLLIERADKVIECFWHLCRCPGSHFLWSVRRNGHTCWAGCNDFNLHRPPAIRFRMRVRMLCKYIQTWLMFSLLRIYIFVQL